MKTSTKCGRSGTTFVRWARFSCPDNGTQLVYYGYPGGSFHSKAGVAGEYLCLPRDPIWGHYEDDVQSYSGGVYGVEYQLNQRTLSNFFGKDMRHHVDDTPCAVCRTTRSSVIMIPGRNQCYNGWTIEYHSYLMSGREGHTSASEFICVDKDPEVLTGGDHTVDKHGKLLYFVEARCGSLSCPPYVNGRELTCVVCSK